MIKRGEIWLVDFGKINTNGNSHRQKGVRPAIIMQNDIGNKYSPMVTVIPLSSNMKKAKLPTHIIMNEKDGVQMPCFALCEQIQTIDKTSMVKKLSNCTHRTLKKVEHGVMVQLGLIDIVPKSNVG